MKMTNKQTKVVIRNNLGEVYFGTIYGRTNVNVVELKDVVKGRIAKPSDFEYLGFKKTRYNPSAEADEFAHVFKETTWYKPSANEKHENIWINGPDKKGCHYHDPRVDNGIQCNVIARIEGDDEVVEVVNKSCSMGTVLEGYSGLNYNDMKDISKKFESEIGKVKTGAEWMELLGLYNRK